ncbi:MAG TPA: hypothetical protein VGR76_01455, partial [Candidatus Angelobacter sp.]|nr:hypothetical protein [Candidatus Angelobacter sp.]
GAAGCFVLARLRSRFNLKELSLAGLIILLTLSWVVALLLPAGSYLLFWPLLFTVIGVLALTLLKTGSARAMVAGTLVGTITTILLFAPLSYLLYIFLTLNLLSIAAIGLLLGIFLISSIPLISVAATQSHWRSIVLPLLAGTIICLGVGVAQSHTSAQHPRRDNLLYSLDADHHAAVWISYDRALDSFTSQFFGSGAGPRGPLPDFLAGSQRAVISAPAAVIDAQPPVSEITSDQQDGDTHNIRMKVRSQRDANLVLIRFDTSVKPLALKIFGRTVKVRPDSTGLTMLLYGMGAQGADLELTLNAPSDVSFWLSDYSLGLPTTKQRSSDLVGAQGSDQTLVCRKYTLGKSGRKAASGKN